MKPSLLLPSLLLAMLIFACTNGDKKTESPQPTASGQLASLPEPDIYSDGKTQLIKNAHVRFQVTNVGESTVAIEAAIRKYPAYISGSSLTLENPILENKMTIRVQSDYFQVLLKEIDTQAVFVNFRNVSTEDVSKEFVDLESRINTKREVEQRYREILQKKAGTIEELVAVEQKIGSLHEDIEAAIGKMNFLRDQVRYSSIQLEFYQTVTEKIAEYPSTTIPTRFSAALRSGWNGLMVLLIAGVYLWPLFALTGIVYGIWRIAKRKKEKVPAI